MLAVVCILPSVFHFEEPLVMSSDKVLNTKRILSHRVAKDLIQVKSPHDSIALSLAHLPWPDARFARLWNKS